MKKISKAQVAVWILAVLPVILAAVVYTRLPAEIPMQWNFGGEVGYEPKWHLWIVACLGLFLAVLFYFMPRFDPKKRSYDKFFGSYLGFQAIMMLFVLVMNGICVVEGLRPGTVSVHIKGTNDTVAIFLLRIFHYSVEQLLMSSVQSIKLSKRYRCVISSVKGI